MSSIVRIATRKSPLALWQAETVQSQLRAAHDSIDVQLVPMTTEGDIKLDQPLYRIGGKQLFVKELESAMMEKRADLAVHSMKDVAAVLPDGLMLCTFMEREDPTDALVSNKYKSLEELPQGAVIGTCSVRRRAQLMAARPDCRIKNLRGNVGTRLSKLDADEYDAIILASAGLKRLGLHDRIAAQLPMDLSLPAAGQGIVGIEVRSDDIELQELLAPLHHADSADRLQAERAVTRTLNGGCSAPIAAYSTLAENELTLIARVISMDGKTILEETVVGPRSEAVSLGENAARALQEKGAMKLLQEAEEFLAGPV